MVSISAVNIEAITPKDKVIENPFIGPDPNTNNNNEAIKVFKVPGKTNGSGYLNLKNWSEGVGGSWLNWSIEDGVLNTEGCPPISCNTESVEETDLVNVKPELITDVIGRKVFAKKNTLLFFRYKNGEIRKRFITND